MASSTTLAKDAVRFGHSPRKESIIADRAHGSDDEERHAEAEILDKRGSRKKGYSRQNKCHQQSQERGTPVLLRIARVAASEITDRRLN